MLASKLMDDIDELDRTPGDARLEARFRRTPAWRAVAGASPAIQSVVVVEAVRRLGALRVGIRGNVVTVLRGNLHREPDFSFARLTALRELFRKPPPLTAGDWDRILAELARFEVHTVSTMPFLPRLAAALKRHASKHGITAAQSAALGRITRALSDRVTSKSPEKAVVGTLKTCAALA